MTCVDVLFELSGGAPRPLSNEEGGGEEEEEEGKRQRRAEQCKQSLLIPITLSFSLSLSLPPPLLPLTLLFHTLHPVLRA